MLLTLSLKTRFGSRFRLVLLQKKVLPLGKSPYAAGGEATSTLAGVSSGFLGALVGGFIAGALFLLSRNTLKFLVHLKVLNQSFSCHFGTILTGFVMLAVNIPMAAINTARGMTS